MAKLLLALSSLALMLYLPAWIKTPAGEPYLILHQDNLQHASTFTEPYHEMMKRVSALIGPKEEVVTVSAWQDSEGNMHFSDQRLPQQFEHTQNYEIKNQYTGRFAFAEYWVWSCMFVVWLIVYLPSQFAFSMLIKNVNRFKKADPVEPTVKSSASRHQENHQYIDYKKNESTSSPHKILGINEGSSLEEIKVAYRNKMKQYHPDKVAHLGKELQDVARKKTTEINRAYELLAKKK